jgi:uncharacterized Fe-S cluster protein YjdI/CDGSH-type Zn-finger protein
VDQPARVYQNESIAVEWYPERCLHTARCIAGLPDVFDPRRRPWIVLEGHTADEIAEVVQRCPTGALHFRRLDGGPQESVPDQPIIEPVPDGPLYVRGQVVIADEAGRVFREDTRVALCRCGQSRQMPFCDNSHRLVGFRDPVPASPAGD